jgi:hypothetical protein
MKLRADWQPEGCTVISSRSNTTKAMARVRTRPNAASGRWSFATSSPSSARTSCSVARRRKMTSS